MSSHFACPIGRASKFVNLSTPVTCSFSKWLPKKNLSSHNFMGKQVVVIKKLLLMITIVVHALETVNQLKNGFSVQYVRFGFIATVSLIDNGRWN